MFPLRPAYALIVLSSLLSVAAAQDKPSSSSPAEARTRAAQGAQQSAQPGGAKPENGEADKKPDAAKEEAKKESEDAAAKPIERPSEPKTPPDPKELEVRPDDSGLVQFHFRNQPWPALIDWLSEITVQPIDWLRLPGDNVNLATPEPYTISETVDLFNRHLLARGYTFLQLDGGLAVVATKELNPALVPSVEPDSLASMAPYSFVRTVFPLEWLKAEELAEELKPMVTPNAGRLVALKATNRLEAMDAAVNLARINRLLVEEQGGSARENLAREFPLRYISAEDAKKLLEQFLGIEENGAAMQLTPQMLQQLQQQMQRSQGNNAAGGAEKEPEISIVANPRINSVIVNAPPDRMAVAEQFINRIDVEGRGLQTLEDIKTRVQVFRLASLDPEKLVEMLSSMNVLEPSTRLEVDKSNQALIVYGSVADRFVISSLIERLDGSGRRFEVLQLRRLDAQEVADSISFLMGVDDGKDSDQNSRRSFYYYSPFGRQEEEKGSEDKFRVAANSRYRQVLLWANEIELEEVRNLLVKLGELPPDGGRSSRIRTIDAVNSPETREYLERLKRHWERISPNPLVLPEGEPAPADDPPQETPDEEQTEPAAEPVKTAGTGSTRTSAMPVMQVVAREPADETEAVDGDGATDQDANGDGYPEIRSLDQFERLFGNESRGGAGETSGGESGAAAAPPPIQIDFDENGNLILLSQDPRALDQLEDLMLRVGPPQKPYTVFEIEHASAFWVQLNLEDYFQQEESQEETDPREAYYRYIFDLEDNSSPQEPTGLAGGNKLRFISDVDTNTIVVSGATPEQLKTIADLIELWDVKPPVNANTSRFTRLVHVRFSRAEKIAETIKEAYRDLLSSNDKTFQNRGGGGGPAGNGGVNAADRVSRNRNGEGTGLQNADSGQSSGSSTFDFKGKLSLGVDEVGNTLLVSAEGESLLELVCDMIDQLDTSAMPQGDVQITKLPAGMGGAPLSDAIRALLGDGVRAGTTESASPRPQTNGGAAPAAAAIQAAQAAE